MVSNQIESREGAPHIAVIGGGTGSFALLQDLKDFTPNISAIVNMSDDGGSTGMLRDEHGVLPPGDARQCLVALSQLPEVRDLFGYRFKDGTLAGQSIGNIMLTGLEILSGRDFNKAVEVAGRMLDIVGEVVPVTTTHHELVMRDGEEEIRGESNIGERVIESDEPEIFLDPPAEANARAIEVIHNADMVVIAPGNFYSSLLPTLAVTGIAEALKATKAHRVMVANLVTKPGQTDDWHVADYVMQFERHLNRNGRRVIDTVLFNTEQPDKKLLKAYAKDGEYPVGIEEDRFEEIEADVVGINLLSPNVGTQRPNDPIRRTLIRHNGRAVGRALMRLHYS